MILDLIYPKRCPVCGEALPWGSRGICSACRGALSDVRQPACMGCGKELDRTGGRREFPELCPDCRRRPRSFSGGIILLHYNEGAKKVLYGLKYQNKRDTALFLAEETVKRHGRRILRFGPEALVPVPLHRSRRRERGYNQAQLLAAALGKELGIPVRQLLVRTEQTAAQKRLGYAARQRNEAGVFRASVPHIREKRLMLVDDIYTTGATAENCTRALLRAGAGEVWILAMAAGRG